MESSNGEEVVPTTSSVEFSQHLSQPTYANITKSSKPTNANITKSQNSGNYTDLFWETMQPVLQHKIPYSNDTETEGDGNCFFNAIIEEIYRHI